MGDPVKLRLNGEIVDLIPVRPAHTGGTLKGGLEALDETMKLAGPNTRLIPSHGTIIHRTDIVPYRDMILGVQAKAWCIRN